MQLGKIIEVETFGGITVISFLAGSISGVSDVEESSAELGKFIDQSEPARVVVDFEGVRFFSSQVLGMLVDIWKRLRKFEGKVVISGINPDLSRVFRITNLDRLFDFYQDRQSALEALKSMPGEHD